MMDEPKGGLSLLQRHAQEQSVTLRWSSLEYSMMVKDTSKPSYCGLRPSYRRKRILHGISGEACSGQLLAIMGPTGCGKTSLLNVLAARVPSANSWGASLTGSVTVNGQPMREAHFRTLSAYVMQDDRMYAHLTVAESLLYAAHFYLPSSVSQAEKGALVQEVISELGLNKAKDTIIGDEKKRGVSGGERKRANIGVQLISGPAVLFLDEPTTGLDSFQAQAVMQCMRDIARRGRLVVTVIHQPRSSIYDMFDRLLLLSEGRAIYLGPCAGVGGLGKGGLGLALPCLFPVNPAEAEVEAEAEADEVPKDPGDSGYGTSAVGAYFAHLGHPLPAYTNPADFLLDLLSPDNRSPEAELQSGARILALARAWAERPHVKEEQGAGGGQEGQEGQGAWVVTKGPPLDLQRSARNVKLLFWRSLSGQLRNRDVICAKMGVSLVFSIIIGVMYIKMDNSQKGIRQRQGLLF
ncbi:P-loop containing nucleoside triphosphate hydrolase protein, partial [Ochromonadaceae sp. CCMP2298]